MSFPACNASGHLQHVGTVCTSAAAQSRESKTQLPSDIQQCGSNMQFMTTLIAHPEILACTQADFAFCCRSGVAYQLPNTAAAKSNVAIFQLTATLPFSMEVVFLGGQSDEQKTIRGPVNMCAGCTPEKSPQPETQPERLTALSGKPESSTNQCTCISCFRTRQGRECKLIDGLVQNQDNESGDVYTCHAAVASTALCAVTEQRSNMADHATLQPSCIVNAGRCSL